MERVEALKGPNATIFGRGLNDRVAVRATGLDEKSDTYRDGVGIERHGINPTMAFKVAPNTTVRASYEFFHDERTADRGISSFNGRPVASNPETFFGDPSRSPTETTVNLLSTVLVL